MRFRHRERPFASAYGTQLQCLLDARRGPCWHCCSVAGPGVAPRGQLSRCGCTGGRREAATSSSGQAGASLVRGLEGQDLWFGEPVGPVDWSVTRFPVTPRGTRASETADRVLSREPDWPLPLSLPLVRKGAFARCRGELLGWCPQCFLRVRLARRTACSGGAEASARSEARLLSALLRRDPSGLEPQPLAITHMWGVQKQPMTMTGSQH